MGHTDWHDTCSKFFVYVDLFSIRNKWKDLVKWISNKFKLFCRSQLVVNIYIVSVTTSDKYIFVLLFTTCSSSQPTMALRSNREWHGLCETRWTANKYLLAVSHSTNWKAFPQKWKEIVKNKYMKSNDWLSFTRPTENLVPPNKNLKATRWCKWTLCDPWVWQILSLFYTDRFLYEPPRNTSYKITVIAWYIWEKTGRAQRVNNELRLILIFCPPTQDHLVMNTF